MCGVERATLDAGLERARQHQDRGKLFRAYGAVPAGA
jgi:hypothetical protein